MHTKMHRSPASRAPAVAVRAATTPAARPPRPSRRQRAGQADGGDNARASSGASAVAAAPPPPKTKAKARAAAAGAGPALPANAAAWSEYEAGLRLGGPPEQGPEDT